MRGYSETEKTKCQDLPKFQFLGVGGGVGGILKLKSQSAKICLNFNLGGGYSETEKTKCQDLPKFQFLGGYSETEKSKCQDVPKFQFLGGGWGGILKLKSQSAKMCLNFNFRGGGGILKLKSLKGPKSALI